MTIDNALSFEVVTADAKLLTASASENEDLFWALRGGGGNFGVVTSFELRAQPVKMVLGGLVVHPRAAAVEVLRFFRDLMQSVPDELTAYTALLHAPDGAPVVGVIPCYCGDTAEGERVLKPLRKFGSPMFDTIQPLPFPAMQSLLDAFFPDGNHKSSMHQELSDDAIAVIVDQAAKMSSPLSMIVVEHYGGAAGRVGPSDTAFTHRQILWDIIIGAQWTNPAGSSHQRAWARGAADALRPFSSGAYLVSALDQEPDEIINAAFGANLPRLAAIKSKYDPANFFRVNQNIRPAQSRAVTHVERSC
jgi:Berberine and berberine like